MSFEPLRPYRPLLLAAAVFGFVGINGPLLYFTLVEREVYGAAMANGMALAFIAEAFFLVFFLAFVIAKLGKGKRPGWVFFVVMSILGSLAFSLPLQLYLMAGDDRSRRRR